MSQNDSHRLRPVLVALTSGFAAGRLGSPVLAAG